MGSVLRLRRVIFVSCLSYYAAVIISLVHGIACASIIQTCELLLYQAREVSIIGAMGTPCGVCRPSRHGRLTSVCKHSTYLFLLLLLLCLSLQTNTSWYRLYSI